MREAISKLLCGAALIKASLTDFSALDVGDEASALAWVRKRAPHATVLVTRGRGETTAYGAHGEASASGKRARCVDATGAGDAFLAGVLATLLAGDAEPGARRWSERATWTEALQVGHSLAVQSVSDVGAVRGVVALAPVNARLKRLKRS